MEPVVLQIVPELETGGVETGVIEMARAMQEKGIKNFVASKGGRMVHELEKLKVPHFTLDLKTKNPFKLCRNAKVLEKIIKDYGINIVHARSRAPAWSAYWAAKNAGVHFMTTFHGTYGLGLWGIKKFYNRVMTYGERVIVISNHIRRHVIENYKVNPDKLRLIFRCADIEKFSPDKVSPERMIAKIKEYNVADDKPVILLPGRITHWKGAHILIEALSLMKNQNFYCIITGDAQNRTAYLESLRELAKKLGLQDRIGFYGRYNDAPALLMISTIVLNTSIEPEAFGRTTVEGLAMGKITIASNIGGSLDIIDDGVNGKLYQYDNPQELAEALDWALNLSAPEKAKISKAAIKKVRDNFTKQIMCDKTLDVYHELIKN